MPKSLKAGLQSHFESSSLSEEQLAALKKLQGIQNGNEAILSKTNNLAAELKVESSNAQRKSPASFTLSFRSLAALFLLVSTLSLSWWYQTSSDVKAWPKADAIAAEVVYNHLKQRPLDFVDRELGELNRRFSQLDFRLQRSALSENFQLGGGRYCSLLSIPAAQLRSVQGKEGEYETLYQVDYRENIFGDLPIIADGQSAIVRYHKGVAVEIWVDKGILFARTISEERM
ncbi:hypothetical protein [Pseudoteredinibacter isoporae]|uniref:Uncharacterized protein n=1 Tax=Pseudoteredinibacter isoporae TaxID=570281 RepID=A0A7X0JUP2_9GAMM|nr:hypothetical protein [Pseudoteredinibacter isoporae]MBB6521646.1 hypothetical protein [Pseudoteredinibacter isoporae]NHO87199.1 hypothetical protein [Pseudoteredinibacter isoporae]NIB23023.1 hypothetical protein [Pseudoteredinibacter isoporae]